MSHFLFKLVDLKNPASLATKLQRASDLLTGYIRGQFSHETIGLLTEYKSYEPPSEKLCNALVYELNRLVKSPNLIQDIQKYAKIVWQDDIPKKLKQIPIGEDLFQLNRLVLEGAYPQVLRMTSLPDTIVHVDKIINFPSFELGPRTSYGIMNDPKHILFILARYKFCAKMLQGKSSVLEVGCGDAFGSPIVAQVVKHLFCIDREPILINGNRIRFNFFQEKFNCLRNIEFHTTDIINSIPDQIFDAVFLIDVIEHIPPEKEVIIMKNICHCLMQDGILIIGTPNIAADKFSSEPGASPHSNLKNHTTLKQLIDEYFTNSFIFSMNDEVVHTGFYPMAHYLFGIGVGLRDDKKE